MIELSQPLFMFIPQSLISGIYWGLFLTILAGPILVALLQTGIERGFTAGMTLGLGVWLSDILYITVVYMGVAFIMEIVNEEAFKLYLGLGGGLILFIFGIGTIISPAPDLSKEIEKKKGKKALTSLGLFLKGFLINTLNPFTIFFWISVTSTVIVKNQMDTKNAILFFGGIMGTIMLTDTMKVWMAKTIKHKIKPKFLVWVRRIAGGALAVFGLALIYKVL